MSKDAKEWSLGKEKAVVGIEPGDISGEVKHIWYFLFLFRPDITTIRPLVENGCLPLALFPFAPSAPLV